MNVENIVEKIISINPSAIFINGVCKNSHLIKQKLPQSKIYVWNLREIFSNDINDINSTDCYIFNSRYHANKCEVLPYTKKIIIQDSIPDIFIQNHHFDYFKKTKILVYIGESCECLLLRDIYLTIQTKILDVKLKIFLPQNSISENDEIHIKEMTKISGIEIYTKITPSEIFNRCQESMVCLYPCIFTDTGYTSILEMVYLGCNVITTNIPSISEVAGEFSEIVNLPFDYDKQFKENMKKTIESSELGMDWCQKFANVAIKCINEYNTLDTQSKINHRIDYIRENYRWTKQIEKIYDLI